MVDLSKQLARAKQSLDRRNYDLAIEVCLEPPGSRPGKPRCDEVVIDASNRKAKEGKKGFGGPGFLDHREDKNKGIVVFAFVLTRRPRT